MTTEQPDIFGVIQGAVEDAWPLMRSRMTVYWILAAVCALVVLATLWYLNTLDASTQMGARIEAAIQPVDLCGAIASFFIIPAAARTVRPEFKLTFLLILGLVGIGLVVGIATEIGLFLLLVPGVWVGVKLSQSTWTYLLSDGKNPFGESWEMTTGHFWETFGFFFLLTIAVVVAMIVVLGIPIFIELFAPLAGVVLGPIAFLGYVFTYHVTILGQMRWMLELRRIAEGRPQVSA